MSKAKKNILETFANVIEFPTTEPPITTLDVHSNTWEEAHRLFRCKQVTTILTDFNSLCFLDLSETSNEILTYYIILYYIIL